MNTYQADVLIHFDAIPEVDEMCALLDAIGHVEGVRKVTPSAKPHLLRVDYDPSSVKARTILGQVLDRSHQACLVGA